MRYLSLFSGIEMAHLAVERHGWELVACAEVDPFASAVIAERLPHVPNLGDVSQITPEQIEALGPLDAIIMGFPCFPKGTLVLTQRGLVDVSEVVVGDMVWTHRNRWRAVSKHHGSRMAETVRMRGHGGSIVTTGNHRFYAASRLEHFTRIDGRGVRYSTMSEASWIEASDMEGMFWSSPHGLDVEDVQVPSWVVDREAFFWCIGLWVADGWLVEFQRTGRSRINSVARRVHWCAAHGQADEVQRKLLAAGITTTRVNERTATKFVKQSMELAEFVSRFGKYAHGKTVPTWMLQASEADRRAFLDGFLFGDGCSNGDGWKATTVSKQLAVGVRLLATSLGWSVAAYLNERPKACDIEGRRCEQRDTWQLVGVPIAKVGAWRSRDGHFYGLVRHVEPTGRIEEVFDIEVEEDHSFVADGMVVHNCQDVSIAGKRKGLKNADGTLTRTGLFFDAMRLVREAHRRNGLRWVIGENVFGLYSNHGGRDFAVVVGELVGSTFDVPRGGWQDTGAAAGPRGLVEWCCLDAQWFGLAQRRERVFFVADFGAWADRPPVLLESESLSGNPPACVAARSRSSARSTGRSRRKSIWEQLAGAFRLGGAPGPAAVAGAIGAADGKAGADSTEGGRLIPSVTGTLGGTSPGGGWRFGADEAAAGQLVPVVSGTLNANGKAAGSATQQDAESDMLVVTPLRASGAAGSNGSGVGYPGDPSLTLDCDGSAAVAVAPLLEPTKRAGKKGSAKDGSGVGGFGDPMFTLQAGAQHGVALAYGGNDTSGPRDIAACLNAKGGASRMDFESETLIAHTLRGGGFDASEDGTGRGTPLVAFHARQDPDSNEHVTHPLDTDGTSIGIAFDTTQITSGENRCSPKAGDPCHPLSASAHPPAYATAYEVRRLTPTECARLQGVPDDYLDIIYRNKPAADGPKYKALGNGFAVPVVSWIAGRINAAVHSETRPTPSE